MVLSGCAYKVSFFARHLGHDNLNVSRVPLLSSFQVAVMLNDFSQYVPLVHRMNVSIQALKRGHLGVAALPLAGPRNGNTQILFHLSVHGHDKPLNRCINLLA
jgi:hypothetical protein